MPRLRRWGFRPANLTGKYQVWFPTHAVKALLYTYNPRNLSCARNFGSEAEIPVPNRGKLYGFPQDRWVMLRDQTYTSSQFEVGASQSEFCCCCCCCL